MMTNATAASFVTVLQHVEPAASKAEAAEMAIAMRLQDGSLGARVIGDGCRKGFAVQGFFVDEPTATWFPDGTRRVSAPISLINSLQAA